MAPLGVLAFWAGLWIAARRYPTEYDWRYMSISNLLYPDRNPDGYQWAWGGLMLCALVGCVGPQYYFGTGDPGARDDGPSEFGR
jgi:hypothetical protein